MSKDEKKCCGIINKDKASKALMHFGEYQLF